MKLVGSHVLPGVFLTIALGAGSGCAQTGSETAVASYQTRLIETATPEQVLDAAAPVLQREFGRVTVDRAKRTIVSAPAEYQGVSDSGTARDLLGAKSALRRVATFVVEPRGARSAARLRIDVQRQDTQPRTALEPGGNRLSDSAASAAFEREAATTREQNAAWTTIRRDRVLERALLDELADQFAPFEEPAAATQAAREND